MKKTMSLEATLIKMPLTTVIDSYVKSECMCQERQCFGQLYLKDSDLTLDNVTTRESHYYNNIIINIKETYL